MWNSDNPFLNGNYAPWREEGDAYDLEVGAVREYFFSLYYRSYLGERKIGNRLLLKMYGVRVPHRDHVQI